MKKFGKMFRTFAAKGGLAIMLALAIMMSMSGVNAFASDTNKETKTEETDTSVLTTIDDQDIRSIFTKPSAENDIFSDVNTLAANTAKSALNVIRTIGAFVVIIGVLITALKLGTGNPQKRQQAKEELGWKIAAAILFIGGAAVLLFANTIAESVAKALI